MSGKLKTWFPIAVFGVLWIDLIRLLSTQWETREQYAYGWFVPFFAAALLWRRWADRPGKGPQDHGTTGQQASSQWSVVSSPVVPWSRSPVVPFLLSTFCFLLLPLRVIYEINTDWPLMGWLYTPIVVALTLYAFHLAGPPSSVLCPPSSGLVVRRPSSVVSPWVRHFAFPVCFILVAVVWPYRIEKGLTQDLMQVVASLTVELLGWLDIPALQRGNLIELGTGTVGVDEACSGIRSFQSCLMAALLMGELYRLRLWPRAALVAIGLALGFSFNVVRTLLLSYQANAHGLDAIAKWHDPAGFTITVACFFCLWGLAVLVSKRWAVKGPEIRRQKSEVSSQQPEESDSSLPSFPSVKNHSPAVPGSPPSDLRPLISGGGPVVSGPVVPWSRSLVVRRYLLAVGCWALVSVAATEAWYRSHTPKDSGVFHWSIALPEGKTGFEKIQLAPRTIKLLKYDLAATGKWRVEEGSEWSAHFFRWQPRSIESVINSRIHRPEVCLRGSGFKQVSDSELIWVEASGLKLPFRKYTYEMDGRTLYVFFCQWEDGAESQPGMQSSGQADRLLSVLKGRRLVGQQTLEIIVTDCNSLDLAEQQLRKHLPALIRPDV
jgi:exosortase/archaeosortase family protein